MKMKDPNTFLYLENTGNPTIVYSIGFVLTVGLHFLFKLIYDKLKK